MNLTNQKIEYTCNAATHQGYLVWDQDIDGPRPGVIVIHEWWGLNDYIIRRADMLAEQGYFAFAIDMYGGGRTAQNPEQAGQAMNAVLGDIEAADARLRAGYDTLIAQPRVDAHRTAAIGYCFGGAMALHMARTGLPLTAVASFHGALGSFHKPGPGEVKAKVLVCHGAEDAMVSMEDVASFRQEMDAADAQYEVIIYPGAQHGFSSIEADENGSKYEIPVGYNETADKQSWEAMLSLFRRSF